jgi:hypothetical protein
MRSPSGVLYFLGQQVAYALHAPGESFSPFWFFSLTFPLSLYKEKIHKTRKILSWSYLITGPAVLRITRLLANLRVG